MTPGSGFINLFPAHTGLSGGFGPVRFGNSVEAPEREQKPQQDEFISSKPNTLKPDPLDNQPSVTPDEQWDDFVKNHDLQKPAEPNAPETPSNPPPDVNKDDDPDDDSNIGDPIDPPPSTGKPNGVKKPGNKEKEKEEDLVAKLLGNTKPFTISESERTTAPIIQGMRGKTFKELKQALLNRSHMNSVVLTYDDDRLRAGLLAQLQAELPQATLLSMDCDGIETKKSPGFRDRKKDKKRDYRLIKTLQDAIPQLSEKLNLTIHPDQPLILILENVNDSELSNLQDSKVYREFQEKFPNVRFIVPTSVSDNDSGGSAKSSFSWMGGGDDSTGAQPWRAGQFQIIHTPTLKPHEWGRLLSGDPDIQEILAFYNITASPDILGELCGVLKKEDQEASLTYEGLKFELDLLGSFVNPNKQTPHALNTRDIKNYTRQVLSQRRGYASTAGGPASMGPKPYDIIPSGDINVSMDDIVGHDKVKKVLMQRLQESQYPNLFEHLNANDPDAAQSTVLLMGESGGGKTLLAKAVAAAGGATFISTSGARFVNGLVGGGANAIRRLRDGIEEAPDDLVIVFIDEMDALGSRSGINAEGSGASGSEDLKTINEFLAFTDGVKKSSKHVLLVGATNRPEALDPAILSRFNYKLEVSPLNRKQRGQLLELQMKQKGMQPDDTVDIGALARQTRGLSGRDIRNMMKIAKDKLISALSPEVMAQMERDENARSNFKLTASQRDLMNALREVKKGKRKIDDNGETGAYSGGNGVRQYRTATM